MALGKYVRIDGHNSSRYCVTISIVVFVSTCFIGAWMAMSSAIGPLGLGLTLQQFMIGMPKKANLNNADVREETLKVNESSINVQASENVIPKEPQSSDLNVSITPNTEKSFSWDEIEKKGSLEENSGKTNNVYTSNQDVPTDNSVDSSVQPQDSTTNQEVPTEKPAYNAAQPQDSDSKTAPNETYPSNQEVPIEKPVDSAVQPQNSDSKTAPNETYPSNRVVPTEKPVDSAVQPQDTDSKTEPNEASTSNREVPAETYVNTAGQPQESDSKTGPNEVSDETNQVELTETKVNKTEGFPETIPSAWINAKNMQDRMANQTEKPRQDKSGNLSSGSTDIPSGLVSDDGKKTSNETSSQVARTMKSRSKYRWKVCNVTTGPDYIPCLDNIQAIKKLRSTAHYEHRERHCPDEAPSCLVPLPKGYKTPIKWPISRDMIWFSNVPHTKLVEYKGGQNWVKVYDRYLTFPGGGTQFKYGALHYIDYLEQSVPDIAWGKQSRVVLDVGCGVASFGGYLFERDVLAMSLAPKDEHEAQVQFALERGIPAISAVMGTKRLPFPSMVFDVIHCARCRVPWHIEGGKLLLELNRLLRPGGYFVWSATPVYRKDQVNVGIWNDTFELTKSICWELVKVERDSVNRKAAAIFRKPVTNDCYKGRPKNDPPFCEESDDSSRAWYTPLQSCIHKVPTDPSDRGSQWPSHWPSRLNKAPYWLRVNEARGFTDDYNRWKHVITNTYLNGSGIDWSSVRNVMDMRASYGGFAAALKDSKVWVMNVVPVNSSDTLPIIYERGLFGIYHDWCESFSTYPRSYGLLHANQLFSDLKKRCSLVAVMAEVDRILRPGGWLIVRDDAKTVSEVEGIATSLHWNITFTNLKDNEQVSCVQKTMWRPSEVETISSAYG